MTILYYVLIGVAALLLLGLISYLRATAKVPTYKTQDLLEGLEAETAAIIELTKQEFEGLPLSKLRERPRQDGWSIGECLVHLNLYGEYYLPAIKTALGQAGEARETFKGSALGEYFAQSMRPKDDGQPKSKMPTFKDKNPVALSMEVPEYIIAEFLGQQEQFLAHIRAAKQKDISGPKIRITISRLIKLSLGDTLRFNVYHNMRHVQQALRAKKAIEARPKSNDSGFVKGLVSIDGQATLAMLEEMKKKVQDEKDKI